MQLFWCSNIVAVLICSNDTILIWKSINNMLYKYYINIHTLLDASTLTLTIILVWQFYATRYQGIDASYHQLYIFIDERYCIYTYSFSGILLAFTTSKSWPISKLYLFSTYNVFDSNTCVVVSWYEISKDRCIILVIVNTQIWKVMHITRFFLLIFCYDFR